MRPLYVNGMGLWSPGLPDLAAWAAGRPDPGALTPATSLFPPALKRRASLLTRAVADAAVQAAREGGADLAQVPTVFASAYGEIATTLEMLEQMATEAEGLPSPTRFHNSVHNTSAGYLSIASSNRSFSTSLAAGPRSFAAGVVETSALLEERGGDLLLVAFDEPPPRPFPPRVPYPLLAVAFHFAAAPSDRSKARLSSLRRGAATLRPPAPFQAHPCGAALLLAQAVLAPAPRATPVALSTAGEDDWLLDVEALRRRPCQPRRKSCRSPLR